MDSTTETPVGFYFSLSYQGEDNSFQEVSGISKELSIEEMADGGENKFKYRLPIIAENKNLVLKRGPVRAKSKLLQW